MGPESRCCPGHRIVLATRNRGKLREIAAVLGALPVSLAGLDEIDPDGAIAEPDECGSSFAENARAKARYYARATGFWALADDSGLEVDALGGAPGVHSARYAAAESPAADRGSLDAANNAKLLRALEGVADEERTARFVCHLALSDGRRTLIETTGVIEGRIGRRPRGSNGFGYDPLFYVPALKCTTAQLPPEEKNEISHRGQATRKFAAALRDLLGEKE